jgi:predicted small secreted protein
VKALYVDARLKVVCFMSKNTHATDTSMERVMPSKPVTAILLAFLLASSFALSACNTAKGFGQDLSTLGNKITGKAEKHTDN